MSQTILLLLLNATLETIYMVTMSSLVAILGGLPLGVMLLTTRPGHILENKLIYRLLSALVNITRSIPFVILMVAIIPLTRWITGTSIGTTAAIVPLSLCAMPFVARVVEGALLEVNQGLIEAAMAMGATAWQIIVKVLIPEARAGIVNGLTLMVISLIGYSAMAGAVGGGGLGDLAIRYGYQRFDVQVMVVTIVVMIVMVQGVQWIGDWVVLRIKQ